MERYNREFNDLFDSPKPGLFVFCERVKEEETRWERRHEDALRGNSHIGRKEVKYPGLKCLSTLLNFHQKKKRRGGVKPT